MVTNENSMELPLGPENKEILPFLLPEAIFSQSTYTVPMKYKTPTQILQSPKPSLRILPALKLFTLLPTMVDALVSAVSQQLTSILFQEAQHGVRVILGVKEEEVKMLSTLQTIRVVLSDAEKRQLKEQAVKVWLEKFQNVSYDIEDVLDEWKIGILKLQITRSRSMNLLRESKWKSLKCSLDCGSRGSKILITTSKENVATNMGCSKLFRLGKLSKEDCLSLFSCLAYFGKNEKERNGLEDIGKKIADKCQGLPLVAKTLGGLLRFKRSREQWQRILNIGIWELDEAENANLCHLRGDLEIRGLGNVTEPAEAKKARLWTKSGLRRLRLKFDSQEIQQLNNEDENVVFEALQPPPQLETLGILYCRGPVAFPSWMTSLNMLKMVQLQDCLNWEGLPPMGKLQCCPVLGACFEKGRGEDWTSISHIPTIRIDDELVLG
ncbi:NB-ARC domain-containing protein [Corchorus olitorius]|uniref:NB-ARC domain-containing protein n=1 Tax=Corchorus olitorius TaxID=93759 RepID=A0A1R3GPP0_9ROSI|nr:NB-ARC domain-containing protein [Corchorus olitorius]